MNYFFDENRAAEVEAELELVAALRKSQVREIAVRAADLSDDSLHALASMVEHVRRLEGLPADRAATRPGERPHGQTSGMHPTSVPDRG